MKPRLEQRRDDRVHGVMHHPVAETARPRSADAWDPESRRRRTRRAATSPPAAHAPAASSSGLQVGEEPGRSHPPGACPPSPRTRPPRTRRSNVAIPLEQFVSPCAASCAFRQPPISPPGLVERARRMLVAPRVQVSEVLGQTAQEPQLLDPQIRCQSDAGGGPACTSPRPDAPARRAPSPAADLPTGTSAAAGTSPPSAPATARSRTSTPPPVPSGRAPRSLSSEDATTAIAVGLRPPAPPRCKEKKTQELNQASSTRENPDVDVPESPARVPAARAGTLVLRAS